MRLELSNRTELARKVLVVLSGTGQPPEPVKGQALASMIGTTRAYLSQVVAPLVDHGWVESDPGPTGGYHLGPEVGSATMLDLIEAVDGPIVSGRCVVKGSRCDETTPCLIHDTWVRTRAVLIEELRAIPALPVDTGITTIPWEEHT